MLSFEEVLLNRISQYKLPLSEGIDWFTSPDSENKPKAINLILFMLGQSGPSQQTVESEIELLLLKKTVIPAIVFLKNTPSNAFRKTAQHSNKEHFIVMLSIFKTSDTYRRQQYCKGICTHEWHQLED